MTTTGTSRSDRALQRAIEEAQARHARIWNAQIRREEDAVRKANADAAARRSTMHVVR